VALQRGTVVFVDLAGTSVRVGQLQATTARGVERAAFTYDPSWLAHSERFALEPALSLDSSPHHPPAGRALFGAFGDSAPDRWGRMLIARAERRQADREARAPHTLSELDYLLGVSDEARQGALRFTAPGGGPFLAGGRPAAPPLIDLPRLLAASDRIEADADNEDDLALLLAPGSSLGGARPKASVRDRDGALAIAKFPKASDAYPVERWEMVAVELARRAGITVPEARLETVANRAVFVARRFDRRGAPRLPFLSAMTLLGAMDGERRSYVEIADAVRRHGARASADTAELWRRLTFSILISNTDDHLRNHGVLYTGTDGWILSPAYDLNPTPTDVRPRALTTTIGLNDDPTASLESALAEIDYFDLTLERAHTIAGEVGRAVARWRTVALHQGLSRADCDRMATAFEHEDLAHAVSLGT
jgi:serine/threonine-protein kinase HipA